ncbi:hypothetical protein AV530_019719 [Patagioenas fasciata monilis]|uniref:Uncharacterized protein n=1 Tax=Patagioenas fasciata monilis TaxID=372326 RepID=A0A1V4JV89_PATFA|nr:hypothetical protein AV530_019719 [Patagioenas fasciata monilis]
MVPQPIVSTHQGMLLYAQYRFEQALVSSCSRLKSERFGKIRVPKKTRMRITAQPGQNFMCDECESRALHSVEETPRVVTAKAKVTQRETAKDPVITCIQSLTVRVYMSTDEVFFGPSPCACPR